jgi:hypothetical protein
VFTPFETVAGRRRASSNHALRVLLWFAKTLSGSEFNTIRDQVKKPESRVLKDLAEQAASRSPFSATIPCSQGKIRVPVRCSHPSSLESPGSYFIPENREQCMPRMGDGKAEMGRRLLL